MQVHHGSNPRALRGEDRSVQSGYKAICEIGKERIRRAGEKIKSENPLTTRDLDVGFRVLKVDDGNMKNVYYHPDDLSQQNLLDSVENIKEDRSDLDLLFGRLLDWGLDLSRPYTSEKVGSYTIHNYDDGKLVACFDENVSEELVRMIAKTRPERVVFRDSSFKLNPEEFILQAVKLINDQKATVIVEHIKYRPTNERYALNVFTDAALRGYPGKDGNAIEAKRHVYDYVLCDSQIEKEFSRSLEDSAEVAVYAKLPKSFYIATPVGRYSPDWAITFTRNGEKHVFFVAETKGHNDTLQLRGVESAKIHCAKEHFKAIGDGKVHFDTVVSLDDLFKAIESAPNA